MQEGRCNRAGCVVHDNRIRLLQDNGKRAGQQVPPGRRTMWPRPDQAYMHAMEPRAQDDVVRLEASISMGDHSSGLLEPANGQRSLLDLQV